MTSTTVIERANPDTQPPLPITILIVDDDIGIRANVHDLLEISGYQVFSATGGLEALGDDGALYHVLVDSEEKAQKAKEILEQAGGTLREMQPHKESLEEYFVRVTKDGG